MAVVHNPSETIILNIMYLFMFNLWDYGSALRQNAANETLGPY